MSSGISRRQWQCEEKRECKDLTAIIAGGYEIHSTRRKIDGLSIFPTARGLVGLHHPMPDQGY